MFVTHIITSDLASQKTLCNDNKLPSCQQGLENSHPSFWPLECEYGAWSVPIRSFQEGDIDPLYC